jgi:putative nucleotidyltransferase with HDIG domain
VKKQILFVDDEAFVLFALRRLLRSHRECWDVEFAESGPLALQKMDERPFDVIVSDMRMPGMDGPELLAEVRLRHPHTVRIILSGQSDEEVRARAVGPAHQYLAKPCDPNTLKNTVTRACTLRDRLASGSLRRLVSQIEGLPSLPRAYQQLSAELRSAEPCIERVAEIIASDVAMTAKVLQLVNSSFFGQTERITDPRRGTKWLGIAKIEPLIFSGGVFSQIEDVQLAGLDFPAFAAHSLAVASRAKQIMAQESDKAQDADDAYLAGMLHDLGKLVLAATLPEEYQAAVRSAAQGALPLWQAEMATLAASHAEVGAYLAGLWGLPDPIVEAIAFHHHPRKAAPSGFTPLSAVHLANALEHHEAIDTEYLGALGMSDRVPQKNGKFNLRRPNSVGDVGRG